MGQDGVKETKVLNASAQACYDVVTDYENYPKWLPEFATSRIVHRESDTVEHVEFTISIKVLMKKFETKYTIRAEKWPDELRTHWTYVSGDAIDNTIGSWKFTDQGGRCRVDYEAMISVDIPISKGIANKVANILSSTTLPRTFSNLEKEAKRR